MRTSYSALETYKQCPQKYKFQEIDRLKSAKTKEAVFGTVVHSSLKFMFEKGPLYPTLDEVIANFRVGLSKSGTVWTSEPERRAYQNEGERILKGFYTKNAPWNFSTVDLESHFEVFIEDPKTGETHVLAGKIDRIDKPADGQYEIIDYKTGRKLPPQEKVDADLQLSIYHLGLQKKWPHVKADDIILSLYFLKHGEKLSTKRTVEASDAVKKQVLATIREIQEKQIRGERFEPLPSSLCDWCSFKPLCPAWKHLYKKDAPHNASDAEIQAYLKEFFSLSATADAADDRMSELKKIIRTYMEQEGYDRVFGEDGVITKTTQHRFSYDFNKVRAVLEPLGRWGEILAADDAKLKLLVKQLSPEKQKEIESAKILSKEFVTLKATAKKSIQG